MLLRLAFIVSLFSIAAYSTSAEPVRYFAIWSYVENAPEEEIEESALADRNLGYWELRFDPEGGVTEGIYHAGGGSPWLILRYVEVDEKIYADLFLANNSFLVRKSTQLASRLPRWPATE